MSYKKTVVFSENPFDDQCPEMKTIYPEENIQDGWQVVAKKQTNEQAKVEKIMIDRKPYCLIDEYQRRDKEFKLAALQKGMKVINSSTMRFKINQKIAQLGAAHKSSTVTDDINNCGDTFFSITFDKEKKKVQALLTPTSIIFLYPESVERYQLPDKINTKGNYYFSTTYGEAGKKKLAFLADEKRVSVFLLFFDTKKAVQHLEAPFAQVNDARIIVDQKQVMAGVVWASRGEKSRKKILIQKWADPARKEVVEGITLDKYGAAHVEVLLNYS